MKKYNKPYRIKKKKTLFGRRFFRRAFLFFLFFSLLSYFLFFSSFFQVKKISLQGSPENSKEINSLVESQAERKILFFTTGSIFSADTDSMEESVLKAFPSLAEVEIERKLPGTLEILAKKREKAVCLCWPPDCFVSDSRGILFEKEAPSDLLKVVFPQGEAPALREKGIDDDLLSAVLQIEEKLQETVALKEARPVSENRLDFLTSEGWEIYFNLGKDLDWQITELEAVLEKQISPEQRENLEYVDLRFSRVFYK